LSDAAGAWFPARSFHGPRVLTRFRNSLDFIWAVCTLHSFCAGRVVKGMGVVHQIENVKVDKDDRPLDPIRIEKVSLQLH
jgi:cyclophilin family peptidyl-prolyl cis-trans isomerase